MTTPQQPDPLASPVTVAAVPPAPPPAAPPAAPPPPPTDEIGTAAPQYVQLLQERNTLAFNQEYQQAVNMLVQQQGITPEEAEERLAPYIAGYQALLKSNQAVRTTNKQLDYAMELGQHYGLTFAEVKHLRRYPADKTMLEEATRLAQFKATNAELARLKAAPATDQGYDSGRGAGVGYSTADQVRDAFIFGKMTSDEFDTQMARFS